MARTIEQILRDTIGGLILDSAMKQSQIEELQENLIAARQENLAKAPKVDPKETK